MAEWCWARRIVRKKQGAGCFLKRFRPPFPILRERVNPNGGSKFKGRAWRIAAIPTLWAAARPQVGKQPAKPSPQPSPTGEGAGGRRAKSSPHQQHSITHKKQPAPHSCTESEKSSLHIEKPSAGCFWMCFRRPSSFPRKRGKSECYRQPAPRAATRKRGYGGATPCRLSGCGDGRCRLLFRFHACRSNHATASMCAVCGNRLSMPAARNA